jgi:hypothetical protein
MRTREWLDLWRVDQVELRSPLSVEMAEERLTAGLVRPRARFQAPPADPDGRHVVGVVRPGHRVRAYAGRFGWDTSFAPLLHARLVPEEDGCRLSGTLGLARWVRVQSLGGIAFGILWTLGSAGALVADVHPPPVPFVGVGALATVLGVVFPGWAARNCRRDAGFLTEWLRERLQTR